MTPVFLALFMRISFFKSPPNFLTKIFMDLEKMSKIAIDMIWNGKHGLDMEGINNF